MNRKLNTYINDLEEGANTILMQWIDDTRMEEGTPTGEGQFNAKQDKGVISLHQKWAFFPLS